MAEYWKSLPRKFCDICKCWFADNKASIDFHERGKRHKENAQKRIQDIQKRGTKEMKKQKELENEMEKIEKAALAAYEKDLQSLGKKDEPHSNSRPTEKFIPKNTSKSTANFKPLNIVEKITEEILNTDSSEKTTSSPPVSAPTKLWYEAMTEEGYKYYWNSETSESRWEPPEEGFVSIEEQNEANSETVSENRQVSEESSSSSEGNEVKEESEDEEKEVKEEKEEETPSSIGPQPKFDPYGAWVTVEQKKPVEYDLQLPKLSEDTVEVYIPIHKDTPSVNFKEKVIGQLSDTDSGEVTFKKRKFAGSFKRNARQRTADDD